MDTKKEERTETEEEEHQRQVAQDHHLRSCPGDVEIPNRVFVKGFAKDCSEEELKRFFEIYGLVHDAKIVRDKTGISKGYAFVSFDSQEISENVRDMGSVMYKDRELVLGPAKIRKKRPILGLHIRPDQYGWQGVIPQQHVPCFVSPDGAWYFPTVPMIPSSPMQYHPYEPYTPPYSPTYHSNSGPSSPTWPVVSQVQMQPPPTRPPLLSQQQSPPHQNSQQHETQTIYNHSYTTPSNGSITYQSPVTITYPINVTTLSPAMSSEPQYFKFQKSPPEKVELSASMTCTSPIHCVPVHYESSFIATDEPGISTETMHRPNIVYVNASNMKAVLVNDISKHIHNHAMV